MGVEREHLDIALARWRLRRIADAVHMKGPGGFMKTHLRHRPGAAAVPIMIAEHRVDTEIRIAPAELAIGFDEHVVEALGIIATVGAERCAIWIDIVAEHDAELAGVRAAPIVHRPRCRQQPRCRHRAARHLRQRRQGEFGCRALFLQPFRPGFSDERRLVARRRDIRGIKIIQPVAGIAKGEERDRTRQRGRTQAGALTGTPRQHGRNEQGNKTLRHHTRSSHPHCVRR